MLLSCSAVVRCSARISDTEASTRPRTRPRSSVAALLDLLPLPLRLRKNPLPFAEASSEPLSPPLGDLWGEGGGEPSLAGELDLRLDLERSGERPLRLRAAKAGPGLPPGSNLLSAPFCVCTSPWSTSPDTKVTSGSVACLLVPPPIADRQPTAHCWGLRFAEEHYGTRATRRSAAAAHSRRAAGIQGAACTAQLCTGTGTGSRRRAPSRCGRSRNAAERSES